MHLRPSCVGTSRILNVLVVLDGIHSSVWRNAAPMLHPHSPLLMFAVAPPVSKSSRNFAEGLNQRDCSAGAFDDAI